jgi:hypothetical protein
MEFEDIIRKKMIRCEGGERVLKSKKIRIFGKMIHDHNDDCLIS